MQALDYITGALRSIGVLDEIDTPSAEQGSAAIRNLNNLMASLLEDGIDLGYTPLSSTTDTVSIPEGHRGTVQALLAQIEASDYGVEIPPAVAGIASNGYNRLLGQAVYKDIRAARSNSLPWGETQPLGRSA